MVRRSAGWRGLVNVQNFAVGSKHIPQQFVPVSDQHHLS